MKKVARPACVNERGYQLLHALGSSEEERQTRYEPHERLVHLVSLTCVQIGIRDDPVWQLVLIGEKLLLGDRV